MRRRIRGILMSGKQFSLDSHLDLVQGVAGRMASRPSSEPSAETTLPTLEDEGDKIPEETTEENGNFVYKCFFFLSQNQNKTISCICL